MKRKIFLVILALIVIAGIWHFELLLYGFRQGKGQLKIISGARPVNEFLNDSAIPVSMKKKVRLVQEVKKFTVDSLGINPTENYTSVYDQKGKPVLWILTASKPYKLEEKTWTFPFLGTVSYKGFFNKELAVKESNELKENNWDTMIRTVDGWSTLGWFKDPILTGMLDRSTGRLVEVIIHELTHGTLFVKDSIEFNENLASFIGHKGALKFLKYKFGDKSIQLQNYIEEHEDIQLFEEHILRASNILDSVYNTFTATMEDHEKQIIKEQIIFSIVSSLDTIQFNNRRKYRELFTDYFPNNAYFMSFRRYGSRQEVFEKEFRQDFGGNLKKYLDFLKGKYPSL